MSDYHVIEKNGWSYVAGPDDPPHDSGPWRYQWEAQEYADELNEGGMKMDVALAYVVTEITDRSAPAKFPGASTEEIDQIARRILSTPENAWQRAIQQNAFRCAAIASQQ